MKNILVITILVLGVYFTGCNNTDTSVKAKGSFSKQEIKTLLKDGDIVVENLNKFMDKYENNEDYSYEVEQNESLTENAIENVLTIEKNNKEKLTQIEQDMLDNLLSRYKYIQNNFEYKQKTYDKACEITGVMLELEGE